MERDLAVMVIDGKPQITTGNNFGEKVSVRCACPNYGYDFTLTGEQLSVVRPVGKKVQFDAKFADIISHAGPEEIPAIQLHARYTMVFNPEANRVSFIS